jgi:hypothetical protein
MDEDCISDRREQLRLRLRQLILLRETGPKNPAWHKARMSLIWRTHDELTQAGEEAALEEQNVEDRTPR